MPPTPTRTMADIRAHNLRVNQVRFMTPQMLRLRAAAWSQRTYLWQLESLPVRVHGQHGQHGFR
jgi:hypothetical protein